MNRSIPLLQLGLRYASRPAVRLIRSKGGVARASLLRPTVPRFFSTNSDLLALIDRELDEEESSGSTELPDELKDLKSTIEKDWKVVDDGAATRLYRTIGSSKVALVFHCQDSEEMEEDDFYDSENEDPESEEGPGEPEPAIRFLLTVTKAGKTLAFTCFSRYAQASILSVATTSEDVETILSAGQVARNNYQGPEYEELANDVQEAFETYVRTDCGINDDVAAFITMYADYTEQCQYVKFMKETRAMLK